MPKILFIAAHRLNRSPSQRYRFEQYFDFLRSKGYECELSFIISESDDKIFYRSGNFLKKISITFKSVFKRLKDISRADQFDIIFVQREAFMTGSIFFEKQFARSKAKLIFDFDDSVWLLDTSEANKKWEWMKSTKKTGKICSLSNLVFSGNSYLAEYAKQFNKNVTIIPTTIDTTIFQRKQEYKNNEKLCIGWSGSHTTIKHFEEAVPILKKIREKYGNKVYFKVMGDVDYYNEELGIKGIPWSSETEVEQISSFDIGIMPLPDDEWVKGKCGLKGLSYMALEVPAIMSRVGVNSEIINEGINGFLANNEEEWINKISQLIESFDLRKKLGSKARETIIERYSVESQKNNYLKHFNELLNR
ncbi:MAG: glycosyl transferase family 1 [Bacteroidetes bacterium RIFCSPLOWO2_12_FULL_35_15]|nr:MAG: glycosyl transferase family 1 [Bacteroidetes bacterium RIFCSPLOWO2_12_FULL_35_15]